jgi:hypothetical protein
MRIKKMKARKFIYGTLSVLQGWYGFGWEDLTASETRREVLADLKLYRENEKGNYRIISRRFVKGVQS